MPHHRSTPAASHFWYTVDTSDEDEDIRKERSDAEESWPVDRGPTDGLALGLGVPNVSQSEVECQQTTKHHGHHLECDTSNYNVVANQYLLPVALIRA